MGPPAAHRGMRTCPGTPRQPHAICPAQPHCAVAGCRSDLSHGRHLRPRSGREAMYIHMDRLTPPHFDKPYTVRPAILGLTVIHSLNRSRDDHSLGFFRPPHQRPIAICALSRPFSGHLFLCQQWLSVDVPSTAAAAAIATDGRAARNIATAESASIHPRILRREGAGSRQNTCALHQSCRGRIWSASSRLRLQQSTLHPSLCLNPPPLQCQETAVARQSGIASAHDISATNPPT